MITSPSNPAIRALAALRNRTSREETGTFLIEGRREIERAHAAGIDLLRVIRREGVDPPSVDAPETQVGPAAFEKIAYGRDGLIAVARTPDFALGAFPAPDLLLVAVAIEKPGNLGALLRTCDAVGAGMLVVDPVTDLVNPNIVRASTGALFTVPIALAQSPEAVAWLGQEGFRLLATIVGEGTPPWELDLRGRCAIAIGNEDFGLPRTWIELAGEHITLPQAGCVDSLNVAVTAGAVLFEAVRQRVSGKLGER